MCSSLQRIRNKHMLCVLSHAPHSFGTRPNEGTISKSLDYQIEGPSNEAKRHRSRAQPQTAIFGNDVNRREAVLLGTLESYQIL